MTLEGRRQWARRQLTIAREEEIPELLQYLASGPICQPGSIYCPAGRLTWAETKAREAKQVVA